MGEKQVIQNDHPWVSERFVQFVDIVFGVVVAQGFVKYATLILDPTSSWFAFWALVGVYATTTLSWIGYHRSMNRYPYETKSKKAWLRMGMDFMIVSVYFRLLFSLEDLMVGPKMARLDNYLLGYLLIFVFYIFTGLTRMWEKNDREASKLKGLVGFGGAYLLAFAVYEVLVLCKIPAACPAITGALNWVFLLFCPIWHLRFRFWRQRHY